MKQTLQLLGLRHALEKRGMFETIDQTVGRRANEDARDKIEVKRPHGVSYAYWQRMADEKVYQRQKAVEEAKQERRSGVEIKKLESELLRAQKEKEAINFKIQNINDAPGNKERLEELRQNSVAKVKKIMADATPKLKQIHENIEADGGSLIAELRQNLVKDHVRKYFKRYGLDAAPKVMYPHTDEEMEKFRDMDIYDQVLAIADDPYLALKTAPKVPDEFGQYPLFDTSVPGSGDGAAAFPQVNAIFIPSRNYSGGATGHEFGHLQDDANARAAGISGADHYADYNGLPKPRIVQEEAASRLGGQIAYDATQQDYFHIPEGLSDNVVKAMQKLNAGIRMSRGEADRQASRGLGSYYEDGKLTDAFNAYTKERAKIRGDVDAWDDEIRRRQDYARKLYNTQNQWYKDVQEQAKTIRENRWRSQRHPAFRGMKDNDFAPGPKPDVVERRFKRWR